jgi:dihydrofolate reductase
MDENYDEIVIIGGGYLFRDTLSVTNKLVLTNVDCDIKGDVFYPEINLNEWKEMKSESFKKDLDNDYDFVVRTYERA